MSKIILQGYIDVPDADLDKVVEVLPDHIALTRAEAGCLVFEVEQDPAHKNRFSVYEEFTSQVAFDAHQRRVKASDWGKITANVQRHYTITDG